MVYDSNTVVLFLALQVTIWPSRQACEPACYYEWNIMSMMHYKTLINDYYRNYIWIKCSLLTENLVGQL